MPKPTAKARRRFSPTTAGGNAERWRRELCAAIFNDPPRITDALSHRITGRFVIEPHHHADLLQLDVIHRCAGQAVLDGKAYPLTGTTLLASPPGWSHGYTLRGESRDAAVWLIKLRVGHGQPTPVPPIVSPTDDAGELRAAAADFVRAWTPEGVGPYALARLAHAIAVWPISAQRPTPAEPRNAAAIADQDASARVRRVIEALGQRIDDPPDLTELAAAASLSPRHFSRCFRVDFGCTPHAYLQARRLDAARGLLRDADRRISDVAHELGFSSPAAFSRWFVRLSGSSPRAYRSDAENY